MRPLFHSFEAGAPASARHLNDNLRYSTAALRSPPFGLARFAGPSVRGGSLEVGLLSGRTPAGDLVLVGDVHPSAQETLRAPVPDREFSVTVRVGGPGSFYRLDLEAGTASAPQPEARSLWLGAWEVRGDEVVLLRRPLVLRADALSPLDAMWQRWAAPLVEALNAQVRLWEELPLTAGARHSPLAIEHVTSLGRLCSSWFELDYGELETELRRLGRRVEALRSGATIVWPEAPLREAWLPTSCDGDSQLRDLLRHVGLPQPSVDEWTWDLGVGRPVLTGTWRGAALELRLVAGEPLPNGRLRMSLPAGRFGAPEARWDEEVLSLMARAGGDGRLFELEGVGLALRDGIGVRILGLPTDLARPEIEIFVA